MTQMNYTFSFILTLAIPPPIRQQLCVSIIFFLQKKLVAKSQKGDYKKKT